MTGRSAMLFAALALGLGAACAWPPRGGPSPAEEPQAAAEQPVGVVEQTAGTAEQAVSEVVGGAGAVVRPATAAASPRLTAPRVSAPMTRSIPSLGGGGGLLRR